VRRKSAAVWGTAAVGWIEPPLGPRGSSSIQPTKRRLAPIPMSREQLPAQCQPSSPSLPLSGHPKLRVRVKGGKQSADAGYRLPVVKLEELGEKCSIDYGREVLFEEFLVGR
jgi:hypothetical protein